MQEHEQLKILLVEDDQESMDFFVSCFQKEYNILCASSGEEALERFEQEEDVAMVLSDQAMPGMTGVELLTHIYQKNESVIRIIITGFLNTTDIIAAINKGHIYQFIVKPWEIVQMRVVLSQATYTWKLKRENRELQKELLTQNYSPRRTNICILRNKPCAISQYRSLQQERRNSAELLWSSMMNLGNL
ncbi:Response regulator receiver domain-containing protein [Candidatus Electrothrix aarhusensis]|uniref:Response regulator receiver domain-containing protein n=1 Tax=Candidatus Electrothrix aarhusensis TaxID=1859131 RepID=A0A3S3RQZ1_9BACT|nr:Response regulator receiver domain-containing protein [Candidatus Electrothrix aarhusensis]